MLFFTFFQWIWSWVHTRPFIFHIPCRKLSDNCFWFIGPPFVPTPIPVAVSPSRLQVLLQLSRVSEQYGKIRQYFLVVAPVHLADSSTEKISIDTVSKNTVLYCFPFLRLVYC